MAFEVISTTDKAQRDATFQDLRKNGNELERQVVKFSGNQPLNEVPRTIRYSANGRPQSRPKFVSVWSLAYPLQ